MSRACELLNRRFWSEMRRNKTRFRHEELTKYWEEMERLDHHILQWARAEGAESRRVKKELEWAGKEDVSPSQ